jgi:UDP-N-acetylmuramyl pentapeptide phosphotransferase/UDP-N-acetylglucosamine-1-phosphate transferase
MTFYILLALSAFLLSLLGTRLTILALRKRTVLLDLPNLRSNHKTPTPRGGGIAVVMALVICLLVADIDYGIILAVFMLAAVSLLDDLINVPAPVRLLVQVMAVLIPISMNHVPLFDGFLPVWLDKTVTAIAWIWFINLFNFMDGIDGISAVEMICIGLGFALITVIVGIFPVPLGVFGMVIAAAGCGFLWWNWHPAKIFLGDVGSVPIGFLLGYLLLIAATSGYAYPAAILPAYYLADGTITLLRRLWQRKKIWMAHSEHYYQKAVRHGRRHDTVSRYVFGVNLLLILLATFSVIDPEFNLLYLAVAYMTVFMMLGFFAHTPHNPHHEPF